jgi:hypothetical protein
MNEFMNDNILLTMFKKVLNNSANAGIVLKYPDLVKFSKTHNPITLEGFYKICEDKVDKSFFKCSFFCFGNSSLLEDLFQKGVRYKNAKGKRSYNDFYLALNQLAIKTLSPTEFRANYFGVCR